MKSRLFALILVTSGGCTLSPPNAPVTPADVLQNIHTWDDEEVTIIGWLGNCRGHDCGIYSTLKDAKTVARYDYDRDAWRDAMDRRLSIGFDKNFDKMAESLQFHRVKLRGRVSNECRGWTGCTDRAPDIYPISISPT